MGTREAPFEPGSRVRRGPYGLRQMKPQRTVVGFAIDSLDGGRRIEHIVPYDDRAAAIDYLCKEWADVIRSIASRRKATT